MRSFARCTVRPVAMVALLLGGVGQAIAQLQPQDPGPPANQPSVPATAAAAVLTAADSGWYNQVGLHNPVNTNYMAGFNAGAEFRNFSVFNLTGIPLGQIASGELLLFNPVVPPGYSSPNFTELFTLFDVSTSIPTLLAGGTGLTSIFNDLGTGGNFGSRVVSASDNGNIVSIPLSPSATAAINTASPGAFAIGGALTSLSGPPSGVNRYVFGFSNGSTNAPQLLLNVVPEPASFTLLALGVLGVAAYSWHCRRLIV